MSAKKSKKSKNIQQWKPVEISGIFDKGIQEFAGFAGLEVLENYDSKKLFKGNTKQKVRELCGNVEIFSFLFTFYLTQFQGINISELEGESYDNRKRKSAEDVEQDSEEQPKKSKQQNGAKVEKKFPGQFVLLKPPQDDDDDDDQDDEADDEIEDEIFSTPEASAIRNVRYFCLFS